MELEEYFKGMDTFANKEKKLFNLIDGLDEDCHDLYNKIYNLENDSNLNVEELNNQVEELNSAYERIKKVFDYLDLDEQKADVKTDNNLLGKLILTIAVFCFLCCFVPVIAFLVLYFMIKALKKSANKVEDNKNKSKYKFDNSKLVLIENTLYNCKNMINRAAREKNNTTPSYSNNMTCYSNYYYYNSYLPEYNSGMQLRLKR